MTNPIFVLAPDSFKESISAQEACKAMEKGIRKIFPHNHKLGIINLTKQNEL